MKIGIKINLKRDIGAKAGIRFCNKLDSFGIEYKVCDNAVGYFYDKLLASLSDICAWCDVIVVFGGDGTMLDTVRNLSENRPLLGINMGKLGFLTETDEYGMDFAIECLLSGNYTTEERALLKTRIDGKDYFALNEIIVSRQDPCHVSVFDVEIDNTHSDSVRSDGILVSTPTGSTAYSLSCNGPVLSPNVKAISINAICPHSLHSCPIVVDDGMRVRISTLSSQMRIIVDGVIAANFDNGVDIVIEKAEKSAAFIRLNNENFYVKLRKKLNYWGD